MTQAKTLGRLKILKINVGLFPLIHSVLSQKLKKNYYLSVETGRPQSGNI